MRTYRNSVIMESRSCGLLLRAGVAPTPQIELVFQDPSMSFIWGDERVHKVWKGDGCGGSQRRFVQFRSFLHIQNWNESEYKKTDPTTGEFVKLDWKTKGPMAKCEPLMSYCRYKWLKGMLPGKGLSLDEMTLGFKGRCAPKTLRNRINTGIRDFSRTQIFFSCSYLIWYVS